MPVVAVAAAAAFWRDEVLDPATADKFKILELLPNVSWYWYVILLLLLALILGFETSFRIARDYNKEIDHSDKAWDRTGKYEIPIIEGLEIIRQSIGGSDYTAAASRIREIGCENQIRIFGFAFDEQTSSFTDYRVAIPPAFWTKNKLNLTVIESGDTTSPQTLPDSTTPWRHHDNQSYGRITITEHTLMVMYKAKPK